MAVIRGSSGRRLLALLLAGAAASRSTAQELQNDAAAALLAAAADGQQAAADMVENPPFHMMPAAADWKSDAPVEGDDPLAAFRTLLDGLDDVDKADILGLDAENGLIRATLSGAINNNFFGAGLPNLLRTVSPMEAEQAFALFPPMQKMPAWQAFLKMGATGEEAAAQEAEAKVASVQELGKAMMVLGTLGSSPESVMSAVRDFKEGADAGGDPELSSLLQQLDTGGGAEVIEAIQEKFLKRTLGADTALTMDDFMDTTWLEAARAGFLGNEDLVRLINDDRVIGILSNPDMVPRKPSQFPDPESLLASW